MLSASDFLARIKDYPSIRAAARALGVNQSTALNWVMKARWRGEGPEEQPEPSGRVEPLFTARFGLPEKGRVHRYILTCAQNNTPVHVPLWRNLLALAEHYHADIMVARFTYERLAQMGQEKPDAEPTGGNDWYAPEIQPYVADYRAEVAPGLVWCGEMNIMPTAVRPLSGLEAYTGRKSGIIPHVKFAMQSIPSGKHEPVKFNYTTGTVTLRNYIQRKAGLKAEFHHCYGALLVEVDSAGDWFVRQLGADSQGVICDLDIRVASGKVTTGNRVEAITWGDVHAARLNPDVARLAWGAGQMFDTLQPKYQFIHDLLDFRARNHHERNNPHIQFERYHKGEANVEFEVREAARLLENIAYSPSCQTVVVDSNHDNALERWLREADYKTDPANAVYYLRLQLAKYKAIEAGDDKFHLLEWALYDGGAYSERLRFLRTDESFIICPDSHGGIECGMHGHLGPNGARGSPNSFAKMGRKAITGHTHSAGIVDGVYTAGTSSELDVGYNKGPSSWSHSHVVTYPNGKRAIVSLWRGKWRAQ